jgi:hypothetical protein
MGDTYNSARGCGACLHDLRLERRGDALIMHSRHNARWLGALLAGFALCVIWCIYGISIPNQSGLALFAYWSGFTAS